MFDFCTELMYIHGEGIERSMKGEYAVNHPIVDGSVAEPPGLLGDIVASRPTLTEARRRAVLSMNELAKKAGVSASTVMDIERGSHPQMKTIRKLAEALGVAPADIAWPGDPLGLPDEDSDDE
jgi:DNA-binding XRE family transcriptional regulator